MRHSFRSVWGKKPGVKSFRIIIEVSSGDVSARISGFLSRRKELPLSAAQATPGSKGLKMESTK